MNRSYASPVPAGNLADATWTRSSYCYTANCVEVAALSGRRVGVRDSKNPDHGVLVFGERAWRDFLAGLRAGDLR